MPKISTHGGPSYEDGREPEVVRVTRPSLVPGATDKGGDESSPGSNSRQSGKRDGVKKNSENPNLPKPAKTTESPSSKTQMETSDADSMDGSIHETATESDEGFGDEFDPNAEQEESKPKATKRAPRSRNVSNDFD